MRSLKTPGSRVMIMELKHSPAMTRSCGLELEGLCGVIVSLIRSGRIAVVRLDGDSGDWPRGVRRWSVALDDLTAIGNDENVSAAQETVYPLGVTGRGLRIVQHGVRPETRRGLCGVEARPLPFSGWSLRFVTSARRACPECVELAAGNEGSHDPPEHLA